MSDTRISSQNPNTVKPTQDSENPASGTTGVPKLIDKNTLPFRASEDSTGTSFRLYQSTDYDYTLKSDAQDVRQPLRSMTKSYWKSWWSGVSLTAGGGVGLGFVASQIGLTAATGGLYGIIGGGIAALGGACLMAFVNVKNGLQSGRQRLRDNWMNKNADLLDARQSKTLQDITPDDWNDVLNFRIRRGFGVRSGFTDGQQEELTGLVMQALKNGASVNEIKNAVRNLNKAVRNRNFSFNDDQAVRALRKVAEDAVLNFDENDNQVTLKADADHDDNKRQVSSVDVSQIQSAPVDPRKLKVIKKIRESKIHFQPSGHSEEMNRALTNIGWNLSYIATLLERGADEDSILLKLGEVSDEYQEIGFLEEKDNSKYRPAIQKCEELMDEIQSYLAENNINAGK